MVSQLGGSVSVSVPYVSQGGTVTVYHVAGDGTLEEMPTTYADGTVTFTTTHFSVFMIQEESEDPAPVDPEEPAEPTEPEEGGTSTALIVGVVAVVIVAIAIAAFVMMRRRT